MRVVLCLPIYALLTDITDAAESVSMVTVSAAAVEASVCIDTVGVRTTSAVAYCTFVDIYTIIHHRQTTDKPINQPIIEFHL